MVGLIQKILLDLVESEGGSSAVAEVRRRARVPSDQIFRLGDVYSDKEFQRLLDAACEVLQLDRTQIFEAYAEFFFKDAVVRFGKWFSLAENSHRFLIFQKTIHNTFASGVVDPGERQAVQDKTSIEEISDRYLITHYRSPNKLCGLYKALGNWVARYYGDEIEITESRCLHRGDDECEMHVKWLSFGQRKFVTPEHSAGANG